MRIVSSRCRVVRVAIGLLREFSLRFSQSSIHGLRNVFRSGFSAHDITESLVSCDSSESIEWIREFMSSHKLEVIGVREHGHVVGYVDASHLESEPGETFIQPFQECQVIQTSTSLTDVIGKLQDQPRLFVSVFGHVGGIVTRTDLQKPPVRMWLFGMVTMIEMRMTNLINAGLGIEQWKQYLSESRLQKAESLMAERARRHLSVTLLDCLQFSDKCQIIARNEALRNRTRYSSRRQVEDVGKKLERLRNDLAHSQDIIANDWDAVVELSGNLETMLENTFPSE